MTIPTITASTSEAENRCPTCGGWLLITDTRNEPWCPVCWPPIVERAEILVLNLNEVYHLLRSSGKHYEAYALSGFYDECEGGFMMAPIYDEDDYGYVRGAMEWIKDRYGVGGAGKEFYFEL